MLSRELVAALTEARRQTSASIWQQLAAHLAASDASPSAASIRQATANLLNRDAAWILSEAFENSINARWSEIAGAMTAVDCLLGDGTPLTEIIWTGPANNRFPVRRIDRVGGAPRRLSSAGQSRGRARGSGPARVRFRVRNSGGPVLDQTGAVVGVVVAKLDALLLAKATGSFPDQINFAIKASAAISFLESKGIEVSDADANAPVMKAPDIADAAKTFTAHVWCVGE